MTRAIFGAWMLLPDYGAKKLWDLLEDNDVEYSIALKRQNNINANSEIRWSDPWVSLLSIVADSGVVNVILIKRSMFNLLPENV